MLAAHQHSTRYRASPTQLRYCDDGAIEIDNSAAERALHSVAVGPRNYLFAGGYSCGEGAAAIYSLSGTAKRNGVHPNQSCLTPAAS